MEKVNKHTVLKMARETGKWFGYIAPNKVNAGNIKDNWCLGLPIIIQFEEGQYLVEDSHCDKLPLDKLLSEFSYYNCNSELGNNVRFWM